MGTEKAPWCPRIGHHMTTPPASAVETVWAIETLFTAARSQTVRCMLEPLRYEVLDDEGKVTATVYVEPAGSLRLDGWPP